MIEKKNFGDKILAFREEISKQDWSPDGLNVNQSYKYLSNQKMKANVMRALVKAGLDFKIDYSDLQIMPPIGERLTQHYIIKAVATITEPGNSVDSIQWTAYGEAADSGDKAISKMQTNAFKNIIANNLLVAELSVEGEDMVESVQSAKDEGKSVHNVKKEVAKETVLKTHAAEPVKTPAKNGPTTVQQTIIEKIIAKVRTLDELTLAPFGTLDDIEQRYHAIATVDDASAFISDYKGVVSLQ